MTPISGLARKGGFHYEFEATWRSCFGKACSKEEKTSSGLYIASAAQELPQRGEVLAVGTGKLDQNGNRIALDVKVGDQVFYGKFGGTEVKVDGEELLLLRADDILAVLED